MKSIVEVSFLPFLLGSVLVFFIAPVRFRKIVLLAVSIVFYGLMGGIYFFPYILFTSVITYASARLLEGLRKNTEKQGDAGEAALFHLWTKERIKLIERVVVWFALVAVIGVLCFTKTLKYMEGMVIHGIVVKGGVFPFLVPLGISYYTFSTVGYLLDVYWKRYCAEKDFLQFFLYTIYFPHIVQGPISRYNRLGTELKKELRPGFKNIYFGAELMLWGFFKKLVIADRLKIFLTSIDDDLPYAGSICLVAMIFDVVMLYTDFSGYMDIVRGASQMFDVALEENFQRPVRSSCRRHNDFLYLNHHKHCISCHF